jgi:hypothetical protein
VCNEASGEEERVGLVALLFGGNMDFFRQFDAEARRLVRLDMCDAARSVLCAVYRNIAVSAVPATVSDGTAEVVSVHSSGPSASTMSVWPAHAATTTVFLRDAYSGDFIELTVSSEMTWASFVATLRPSRLSDDLVLLYPQLGAVMPFACISSEDSMVDSIGSYVGVAEQLVVAVPWLPGYQRRELFRSAQSVPLVGDIGTDEDFLMMMEAAWDFVQSTPSRTVTLQLYDCSTRHTFVTEAHSNSSMGVVRPRVVQLLPPALRELSIVVQGQGFSGPLLPRSGLVRSLIGTDTGMRPVVALTSKYSLAGGGKRPRVDSSVAAEMMEFRTYCADNGFDAAAGDSAFVVLLTKLLLEAVNGNPVARKWAGRITDSASTDAGRVDVLKELLSDGDGNGGSEPPVDGTAASASAAASEQQSNGSQCTALEALEAAAQHDQSASLILRRVRAAAVTPFGQSIALARFLADPEETLLRVVLPDHVPAATSGMSFAAADTVVAVRCEDGGVYLEHWTYNPPNCSNSNPVGSPTPGEVTACGLRVTTSDRRSSIGVHSGPGCIQKSPRKSHAVTRSPHAVTRSPHAVTRSPYAVTRSPHALTRSPHVLTHRGGVPAGVELLLLLLGVL